MIAIDRKQDASDSSTLPFEASVLLHLFEADCKLSDTWGKNSGKLTLINHYQLQGNLHTDVLERRTATESEAFSFLTCFDATKFALLTVFKYSVRDDLHDNLCKTTAHECETSTSGCRPLLNNAFA